MKTFYYYVISEDNEQRDEVCFVDESRAWDFYEEVKAEYPKMRHKVIYVGE